MKKRLRFNKFLWIFFSHYINTSGPSSEKPNSLGVSPTHKSTSLKFKPKLNILPGQISFLSQVQCVAEAQERSQHRWQCLRKSYFGAKTASFYRRTICTFLPPAMRSLLSRPTNPQSSQICLLKDGMGNGCLEVWLLRAQFPILRKKILL